MTDRSALEADGYLCETADVWRVVVAATARRGIIEATIQHLAQAPDPHSPCSWGKCSNTIRSYLNEAFAPADIPASQTASNAALASQVSAWLTTQPQKIACDLHDEPYYGKVQPADADHPETDPDCWVCRGEVRAGTTDFYRCASAYVMRRRVRFTLAVKFVHPGETMAALDLAIQRLDLDKGFGAIPVIRDCLLLTFAEWLVIMACPIRGQRDGKGTYALCQGRASYRITHTFANPDHGQLTVPLEVAKTYCKRRNDTRKVTRLMYVLLDLPGVSLRTVRKRYRRRFRIESSYRWPRRLNRHQMSNL